MHRTVHVPFAYMSTRQVYVMHVRNHAENEFYGIDKYTTGWPEGTLRRIVQRPAFDDIGRPIANLTTMFPQAILWSAHVIHYSLWPMHFRRSNEWWNYFCHEYVSHLPGRAKPASTIRNDPPPTGLIVSALCDLGV